MTDSDHGVVDDDDQDHQFLHDPHLLYMTIVLLGIFAVLLVVISGLFIRLFCCLPKSVSDSNGKQCKRRALRYMGLCILCCIAKVAEVLLQISFKCISPRYSKCRIAFGISIVSFWFFLAAKTVLLISWAGIVESAYCKRGGKHRETIKRRLFVVGMCCLGIVYGVQGVAYVLGFTHHDFEEVNLDDPRFWLDIINAAVSILLAVAFTIYGIRLIRLCHSLVSLTASARFRGLKRASLVCVSSFTIRGALELFILIDKYTWWKNNIGIFRLFELMLSEVIPMFVVTIILYQIARNDRYQGVEMHQPLVQE